MLSRLMTIARRAGAIGVCLWAWLSGKKTVLAAIYWALFTNAWPPFWKDVLGAQQPPEPWNWILNTIGIVLTVVGLGHKVFKRKTE